MSVPFQLRQMTPADSPALAVLTQQSPDGGRITLSPRFHIPAYDVFASHHDEMIGVVAEVNDYEGLVGAARVRFGVCQFEGKLRPYALLSSLMVHPDFRRRGIASALAQWRIERAIARNGSDGVILADIQTGNVGSTANARKWASQISGRVIASPVSMRTRPPKMQPSVTIRAATAADLESIAENLNTFFRDYNFYRPQSAQSLRAWLQATPLPTPVHHYLVAVDASNRLLAGIGIREEGRLSSLFIEKMPPVIQLANLLLKVVPKDREMRNLQAENVWFLPGQLAAAQLLWQTIRWEWRDRGSSLVCNYDPRGPLRAVMQTPPWMPTTSVSLAVRAPLAMSEARLLDALI